MKSIFCDEYCIFPDEYTSEAKMWEEKCNNCPLNDLECVLRCKNCKYYDSSKSTCTLRFFQLGGENYCSMGERK